MNIKDFKDKISKGLGSAILFLKNNPEQAHKYSTSILWVCCHDTRYDSQCESGRSGYLYEAICLSNRKEQLEDRLLEKLLRAKRYEDVEQLFAIAERMHDTGNIRARKVMYDKFKEYSSRIQKIKVFSFSRNRNILECATAGAINIISMDKFEGLEFVLDTMGSIMISKKIKELFDTDWVLAYAKNELGEKNLNEFLKDKSSVNENIKVLFQEYKANQQSRYEYQQNKKAVVPNFENIISMVERYCFEDKMRLGRRNILCRMGKKADAKELIKVARELENTVDESKQIALLHVFRETEYPLPIDFLLKLACNSNKMLVGTVAEALKNTKDHRIHNLAIRLIKDGELCIYGLGLLRKNFQQDYELILELLRKAKDQCKTESDEYEFHSFTMEIRAVFECNKSVESADILEFLYQNTTCSYCRQKIVQIMCDNDILSRHVAEECLYDCEDETRAIAVGYFKTKGAFVKQ